MHIQGDNFVIVSGDDHSSGSSSFDDDLIPTPSYTEDVEPWPGYVNGEELLDEISSAFLRFLSIPDGAAALLALWSVATHAVRWCEFAPRLLLKSPVRRCGKTTALAMLERLVRRPIASSSISPATIYRIVELDQPCLLLDEADTFAKTNRKLTGIINSGHSRTTAFVLVTEGGEPVRYSTFCAMVIAGIGDFPATIEDRSLVIPMRRAAPHEPIERLRPGDLHELSVLARKADRWARENRQLLDDPNPEMPDFLNDRAADNLRMLMAIADAVSPDWGNRARKCLSELWDVTGVSDVSPEETLLGDLRDFFQRHPSTRRFTSEQIVHAMHELDRWAGMNAQTMARMLKPFGIAPKMLRIATGTQRGYEREMFRDAFDRYAPKPETTVTT